MSIIEHALLKDSDQIIRSAFSSFLNQPEQYRNNFLQTNYKTAFDGYSFIGQKDSLNQYETDMLHSFVLSDFQKLEKFPGEFHNFLLSEWKVLTSAIRDIELELIHQFNLPVKQLYDNNRMGYMMSCNYYPKTISCQVTGKNNTRLSAHSDASLITHFPFGVAEGLSFYDEEELITLENKKKMISFFGYFTEFISESKTKALNHRVELPKTLDSERFSFAIFSLPKPDSVFTFNDKKYTGTEYYNQYLSQF